MAGFRTDVFLAGAKIERFYGVGPLPGCAAMITLEEGFAEVLTLAPDAAPPERRL